ncbi:MAG: hypothetical protein V1493_01290 [Candidatus Diapherotrites archaeon]
MPRIIMRLPFKEKSKTGEKRSPVKKPKAKRKKMTRAGRSRGWNDKLAQARSRSNLKGAKRKGPRNTLKLGNISVPTSKTFASIHTELFNRSQKIDYTRPGEATAKRNAIADEYMQRIDTMDLEVRVSDLYSNKVSAGNFWVGRGETEEKTLKGYVQARVKWLEEIATGRSGIATVPHLEYLIELRLAKRILGKLK